MQAQGRGFRRGFCATGQPGWMRFGAGEPAVPSETETDTKQAILQQLNALQTQMDALRQRLDGCKRPPRNNRNNLSSFFHGIEQVKIAISTSGDTLDGPVDRRSAGSRSS